MSGGKIKLARAATRQWAGRRRKVGIGQLPIADGPGVADRAIPSVLEFGVVFADERLDLRSAGKENGATVPCRAGTGNGPFHTGIPHPSR